MIYCLNEPCVCVALFVGGLVSCVRQKKMNKNVFTRQIPAGLFTFCCSVFGQYSKYPGAHPPQCHPNNVSVDSPWKGKLRLSSVPVVSAMLAHAHILLILVVLSFPFLPLLKQLMFCAASFEVYILSLH